MHKNTKPQWTDITWQSAETFIENKNKEVIEDYAQRNFYPVQARLDFSHVHGNHKNRLSEE